MFFFNSNSQYERDPRCVQCQSTDIHMQGMTVSEPEITLDELDNYQMNANLELHTYKYKCNNCGCEFEIEIIYG